MDNSGKITNNIFSQPFNSTSSANPFSTGSDLNANFTSKPKTTVRLNGYDSAILNKANFDDSEEQELSFEYRIKEKESILKDLDEKIKLADNYGTQNESLGLKAKKQRISEELSILKKQKAAGNINFGRNPQSTLKEKLPAVYKIHDFISRNILARVSKKVRSIVTLTDSLEQLSDISKSVDELADINIPYGERIQNYEKLTQYLSQANSIHSKITKTLKNKGH